MLNKAFYCMVNILKVCCVTMRCCAPEGMAVRVAHCLQWGWTRDGTATCLLRWEALMLIGVKGLITLVAKSIPGMLLHVMHWCSLGVDFSVHFAIGFHVSITSGALVSQGTVSMGESSITLCCALHSSC
jgi:hypothetical protein